MCTPPDRGVVFLTAPAELGRRILADVRARFPDRDWTVYFRATQSDALDGALAGLEAISDKPGGSKLAFVKAIRGRRYSIAVIAWTRHRDFDRIKIVGMLSGATRLLIYNENLESFWLDPRDTAWLQHAWWRLSVGRGLGRAGLALLPWLYKHTAGLVIGSVWLTARLFLWRVRRAKTRAEKT